MFNSERFITDCQDAIKERDTQAAIQEVVAKAVSNPSQIVQALGEPEFAGLNTVYHSDDLTILNIV